MCRRKVPISRSTTATEVRRGGLRIAKGALAALTLLPGALAGQIELSGGVNVVAQGADVDSIATEMVASLDLFLGVPAGPGRVRAYVEVSTTPFPNGVFRTLPEANTDAGTALNASGDGRAQLSELAYEWIVSPGAELHLGLLDATGYLDVSRISNDENLFFLAVPFVNNPTIEFPDYAPAAAFSLDSRGWIPGTSVVVSGSHGIADNPGRGYRELLDYTPTVLGLDGGWTGVSEHADPVLFEDIQQAEAFLRFHLHGNFFFTASTQWIRHSGFRAEAPAVVVSGARLSWVF